ncbi:TetR/AcrR family transcriptional regulator [Halocola ammonii]
MKDLLSNLHIQVNENVYIKDPESSELGKRIIRGSISLLIEVGFDAFTFHKLAKEIQSTEASVYRYFENKHKLLLYLFSWYWSWMEYKLVFALANIESPKERLGRAIEVLTREPEEDNVYGHINERQLNQIIIAESSKAYLTREVDEENKMGAFSAYKRLVGRVSEIVTEISPEYKYPRMVISTVIEGAHHQRFFASHLRSLTDVVVGEDSITSFYKQMVMKSIESEK